MTISRDISHIAGKLSIYDDYEPEELSRLRNSANAIGRSWSGSWLGHHSKVYYADFQDPPPGAAFSVEWGLDSPMSMGSRGDWREYNFDDVVSVIKNEANNPDLNDVRAESKKAEELFNETKSDALSLIYANIDPDADKFLNSLVTEIESIKIHSGRDFIEQLMPSGQVISRDRIAIEKGFLTPPHISVLADIFSIAQPFKACTYLKDGLIRLSSHIENTEKSKAAYERVGTNVFIGHGQSPDWRELKDFVHDRLGLPWDEFNRVPIAGVTNIARLSQMLDQACIAFLVLTAEDEKADGNLQARMNVIHEVGLFQGRLGFDRAIVLLEEDCQEFSNIQGLGQIRFPRGKISASFEEIRKILEREGIIEEP